MNWKKVLHIGEALAFSPLFGFMLAMALMFLLKTIFAKNTTLFESPDGETPPPMWIRSILIITCSLVSFFHGSNDGQKGIGLMMLILIGFAPAYFALSQDLNPEELTTATTTVSTEIAKLDAGQFGKDSEEASTLIEGVQTGIANLQTLSTETGGFADIESDLRFDVRKNILLVVDGVRKLESLTGKGSDPTITSLAEQSETLAHSTEYAPWWVIILIALSLGIGTMIGWKRIVVTIGEKIGKTHLSYAQGASAELVAASTIACSTFLHLPVSTTHVLSSGIAGTMFARGGKEDLQSGTIKKIIWAWVLTVPFCVTVSGLLFILFRTISG